MNYDFDDPRIITLEEMMNNTSMFPTISNNSLGKATGQLIKSLLNNLGSKGNNGSN